MLPMNDLQTDREVLAPLVEELLTLSARPEEAAKKRLWADHQAMGAPGKIPVCVYYEGIPETQWKFMLAERHGPQCRTPLARAIEWDLKTRLWIARNVGDDHIVWPNVMVYAAVRKPIDWGVSFGLAGSDNPEDARRMQPAFPDGIDVGRLHFSDHEIDDAATAGTVEQARQLVGPNVRVFVRYPNLGCSPFDMAVEMRGMEGLMMDAIDAPEKVCDLMEYLTSAFEGHHRRREQRGWINIYPSADGRYTDFGWRVHCAYLASDFDAARPRLADEWAYVSAQTAACLGPEMYARFVHPYNVRLASFFAKGTVYYHGCECLDQKLDILATLPNLRRFHVSPWSSVAKAAAKFAGKAVLEVHAHPGRVFFGQTPQEMREEIGRLTSEARSGPASLDLNLSDIHSINAQPHLLTQWAQIAQELAGAR